MLKNNLGGKKPKPNKLKTAVLKMCAGQGNKQHTPADGELSSKLSLTRCLKLHMPQAAS